MSLPGSKLGLGSLPSLSSLGPASTRVGNTNPLTRKPTGPRLPAPRHAGGESSLPALPCPFAPGPEVCRTRHWVVRDTFHGNAACPSTPKPSLMPSVPSIPSDVQKRPSAQLMEGSGNGSNVSGGTRWVTGPSLQLSVPQSQRVSRLPVRHWQPWTPQSCERCPNNSRDFPRRQIERAPGLSALP